MKAEILPVGRSTLLDLAAKANREHTLALEAGESMIGHAIRSGEALIEAKAQVDHGEWLPWLEVNFVASEWTARAYMRVAANRGRVTDLEEPSLRNALRAIATDRAQSAVEVDEDDHTVDDLFDQDTFDAGTQAICPTCGGTGVVPVEAIGGVTR